MTTAEPRASHHHGNLKEALVAYTIAAADRGALAELSLRKAARDLGVSPGAAYRHFPDKDALMRLVAERGFDALAQGFEAAIPYAAPARDAADARRRFVALATAYADFARSRKELWRLMFGPLGLGPARRDHRPSTYDWLAKSLEELAGFGLIAPPGAEERFFAWTVIHGLSDLQGAPAIAAQPRARLIEAQCARVIAALRTA